MNLTRQPDHARSQGKRFGVWAGLAREIVNTVVASTLGYEGLRVDHEKRLDKPYAALRDKVNALVARFLIAA